MKKLFYTIFLSFLIVLPVSTGATVIPPDCIKADKLSMEAAYNPGMAAYLLDKAVNLCRKSASLRYNFAIALYDKGEITEATNQLEKAVEINRRYAPAYNVLVVIELENQNFKKAEVYALKAVELDPYNFNHKETR